MLIEETSKKFLCIGSSVLKVFKPLIYTQTSKMWYIFVEQYSMYYPNCELNRNQKQTGCFQLTEEVVIFCEIDKFSYYGYHNAEDLEIKTGVGMLSRNDCNRELLPTLLQLDITTVLVETG